MTANTPRHWVPALTAADLHKRRGIGSRVVEVHAEVLATHPSGYRIRFVLPFISDYAEHLAFTAAVFNPQSLAWNEVWTMPGTEFEFGGLDDRDAQKDPATTLIARRHDTYIPDVQAASWQKIINALAARVDQVMASVPPLR